MKNLKVVGIDSETITFQKEAWYTCHKGDWLLRMATKLKVDKRKLVLCAALCAHTVIQYMQDARSRDVVRTAFLWGRGKATDKQLMAAWESALPVCTSDPTDATSLAAFSANAAALAAFNNIAFAAFVADATAKATTADDADVAKEVNQLRTATIVRKICTEDVMKKLSANTRSTVEEVAQERK